MFLPLGAPGLQAGLQTPKSLGNGKGSIAMWGILGMGGAVETLR